MTPIIEKLLKVNYLIFSLKNFNHVSHLKKNIKEENCQRIKIVLQFVR